MSNVKTKVIDFRHKAPDQAIHELMQATKDGYAVTKIVTRFNHTHVYLEVSYKQVSTKQVSASETTESTDVVEKAEVKAETVKPVAKKTTSKATTAKKTEQGDKDAE